MGKLQGKVAVITGGTQVIGVATAKLFASEGAYVFITGRRQKELEEAVAAVGGDVTGVQGDVAKLADLDRLYESVKAKGRIDVLFANVGLGGFVPLGSITEEYYDKTFDTNVKGLLFTVQKALPFLNDGASIILTGSAAAAKGTPSFGIYAASKAAIRSFVRTWTAELKDRRIRANVLSPGPVITPQVALQPPEAIAHRLHRPNRPHGGARRDRQGRAVSGLGRLQLCHRDRTVRRWRQSASLTREREMFAIAHSGHPSRTQGVMRCQTS
jgi:NAD(P)-dependent dehydrogenase (short-subunit alcohol dehydrogenase family)